MMSNDFPHPFRAMMQQFAEYRRKLPMLVSGIAEKEFKENFTRQGYRNDSGGVTKWKPRHQPEPKRRQGRALLIKSGRLRRGFKKRPDANTARVINDVPYAAAHNEGSKETVKVAQHVRRSVRSKKVAIVKAHMRKNNIPARPIMITTKPLLDDIDAKVLSDVTAIYNNVK
jgi:phage gpG-like protein